MRSLVEIDQLRSIRILVTLLVGSWVLGIDFFEDLNGCIWCVLDLFRLSLEDEISHVDGLGDVD